MSESNAAGPETNRKLILLVEDEALIALTETVTLERYGYAVRTAAHGEAAVAEGAREDVDLILMDIDLGAGAMDGTRAAQRILERREVPIVFLTSHNEREMVERVRGITRYGYVLKNSGEFVLIQSIETAFELFEARRSLQRENEIRRRAEQALTERNTFIETILDNLPIGLAVNYIDDGRASYLNREFASIYGWPKKVLADIPTFFESVYPDEEYRKQMSEQIMSDIASRDPRRMVWRDVRITRQSGETAYVDAVNIPIYDQNFMISTVIDVSERHCASAALAESEARYRAVARNLPNGMIALFDSEHRHEYRRVVEKLNLAIETAELGVWSRDTATEHLEWNDELLRIYGLSREEFEANPDAWRMVHPDDLAYAAGELARIRNGQRVRDVRFRIRRPDGEIRHVAASGVPVVSDGIITTLIGISVDITDSVERERQLADALAHLETAVRESNHRIKNNLLTVLSLIDLAENSDHSFSNVTKQINAFVAVHDALGQAEHLGRVEIRSLLHEVAEPHLEALTEMGGRLTIESAEHVVDSKQAVPIVLIVNELVSNAIRHGVRPGANDFVRITVSSAGDEMRLAVTNSGARLPENGPDSGDGSIGWNLIRALADQVGASICVARAPHTSIVVTVPVM